MKTIPMNTPADYEKVAAEMLDDFVLSFSFENGCIGYVSYHEGIECISQKGINLYERYCLRLFQIGQRLFPGMDMKIESSYLAEVQDDE